jgi:hypothetical protein
MHSTLNYELAQDWLQETSTTIVVMTNDQNEKVLI